MVTLNVRNVITSVYLMNTLIKSSHCDLSISLCNQSKCFPWVFTA